MKFAGVDEETREPDESAVHVASETWGGAPLVRVTVGEFDLPQYHRHAYVTAETALELGAEIVRLAEDGILRAAGWLPVTDPASADARAKNPHCWEEDDWTPPEDRGNFWNRDLALVEARLRARRHARE